MIDFDDNEVVFLNEKSAAIVTRKATSNKKSTPIGDKVVIQLVSGENVEIFGWGPDNDLPTHRETLVAENNIVPSLMATKRDITLGKGIMAYRKRLVDGEIKIEQELMGNEQQEFFDRLEEEGYWLTASREQAFHSAVATEFVRGRGTNSRIESMRALHLRHLRSGYQDLNGKVNSWFWSGQWGHERKKGGGVKLMAHEIPLYDRNQKQSKFLLMAADNLLCLDEYYPMPYWWGSEEWIRLANCIPEFHQANLRNGYTLRWHIEIPKGYFSSRIDAEATPEERASAKDKAKADKAAFIKKLNDLLAGVENAGRAVITNYEINKALSKDFPGIKINPLETNLQDEAMLKLFEKSNQANISAQGVHPTLANIETAGKLSSGTEIRNAYLMYLAIKTPQPRKQLMQAIKLVKRENNWPADIHYGFLDMTLERLSEDKSGTGEQKDPA